MAQPRRERRRETEPRGPRRGLSPTIFVTLLAALLAGIAGHMLPGVAAWAAVGAVVLVGAYAAAQAGRGSTGGDAKARRVLSLLDRGGSTESKTPQGFAGEWAALYERANQLAVESQTNSAALAELERFRRQAELAESALRGGKDPLTEIAELRVGPLRDLLEAAKNGATVGPVVSRLPLGEEELIGSDGDTLPEEWPKGAAASTSMAPHDHEELGRGLDELLRGLGDLSASLSRRGSSAPSAPDGDGAVHRSPAQLVDAVVHTAADGIEDLAAGLMRANELASVAERVTNRATLLALNAALEATRSGSEAFAAIAEETRRLAEFAREATDTISRLASEIEYKVGETITAIHATSEDAKTSLAELSGVTFTTPTPARRARAKVEALLERARGLKRVWGAADYAGLESHSDGEPAHGNFPDAPCVSDAPDASEALDALGAPAHAPEALDALGVPAHAPEAPEGAERAGDSSDDSFPMQSLVENDRFGADKLSKEGILLIEGLQPGARLES